MYQDLGVRIVVLGAGEARRNIGMVRSDLNTLESTIRKVSGTTSLLGQNLTRLGSALTSMGRTLTVSVTTPLLALGGALVGTGASFEDAFAGVGKTVDGVSNGFKEIVQMTPELNNEVINFMNKMNALGGPAQQMTWDDAFNALLLTMPDVTKNAILADERFGKLTFTGEQLRKQFIDLSLQIPFTANALADIGRVAGQMGVPADQLIEFTKVVAELGVATNISGEDAAFAIARTANIFGVSSQDMGKFALQFSSALVDLGNSTAATESEILNISTRMSAVGKLAGMSVPDILGWGASMAEMGVRSELGGTAFSRVIYEMLDAVNAGGDALKQYADVAGVSADQFAETFRTNPTQALGQFLSKLTELEKQGKIDQDTLTAMGFEGIRVKQVMDLLGPNMELVTTNVSKANTAWQQQIALQQEAQKKFATTKAKIMLVRNAFVAMGITVFDLYKNKIDKLLERLQNLFLAFKKLPAPTQKWIVTLGLLAAAAGPVLVILGTILQSAGTVITAFSAIPGVIGGVIASFVGLLPVLIPIVAIAGIIYLAWSKNFAGIREVVHKVANDFKWFKSLFLDKIVSDLKKGDFSGAFDGLKNAFNAALDWFDVTGIPLLKGMFDTAKSEISSKLDEIKTTVENKLGSAGSFLESSLPTLFKGVTDTAQGFKDFFSAFEGTKTAGFNEIWKTLLIFLGLLATLVGAGLSALAPTLKPLGEGLSNIITATSNWLQVAKPAEKLIEFLRNFNQTLKDFPDNILPKIGEQLAKLNPESIGFLAIVIGALAIALATLSLEALVLFVIVPIIGILATVLTALGTVIIFVITPILILAGAFLALKNNTFGVTDNIRKVADDIEKIKFAVGDGNWVDVIDFSATALKDLGTAVASLALGTLTEAAQAIVDIVGSLTGMGTIDVESNLKAYQPILDLFQRIAEFFLPFGENSLTAMVANFVANLPTTLGNLFTTLTDNLFNPFDSVHLSINSSLFDPAVPTSLISKITGFPAAVVNALKGLGDIIKTGLYDPFATWLDGIKGLFSPILDAINTIKNALGGDTGTQISPADVQKWNETNPENQIPQGMGTGQHGASGGMFKGWTWTGENGPELVYSASKYGVIPTTISKAIASLANPPAPSAITNNNKSSVYSPVFNGPPTSEVMRSNTSLYEEWLRSSQGI